MGLLPPGITADPATWAATSRGEAPSAPRRTDRPSWPSSRGPVEDRVPPQHPLVGLERTGRDAHEQSVGGSAPSSVEQDHLGGDELGALFDHRHRHRHRQRGSGTAWQR